MKTKVKIIIRFQMLMLTVSVDAGVSSCGPHTSLATVISVPKEIHIWSQCV